MTEPKREPPRLDIKIADEELKGRYSNLVRISHTREEFFLDFLMVAPPTGTVTARVILSPGHVKRVVTALQENLAKYEATFGTIRAAEPPQGKIGVN